LTFCVDSENIRSQTLVRSLGAVHEATLQDAGNPGNMLIFALFPDACKIWRKINGQRRQCSPSS
jgi:RimJ/RimL family protein N-acetyltransferase